MWVNIRTILFQQWFNQYFSGSCCPGPLRRHGGDGPCRLTTSPGRGSAGRRSHDNRTMLLHIASAVKVKTGKRPKYWSRHNSSSGQHRTDAHLPPSPISSAPVHTTQLLYWNAALLNGAWILLYMQYILLYKLYIIFFVINIDIYHF